MPNTCKSNEESFRVSTSGARVRNTWVICPRVGDNQSKDWLIPDKTTGSADLGVKGFSLEDESMRD